MSKYKLTFTLKQHTPIIHFQHNQAGATLRATEVKPKLDRFIIKKMGGWDNIPMEWRVGGKKADHHALDYKMRINDRDDNTETGDVNIMPGTTESWIFSKNIEFCIQTKTLKKSNDKTLKECILEQSLLFFATHNFGKRQSKGFGCFYPESLTEKHLRELLLQNGSAFYRSNTYLKKTSTIETYFYDKIIFRKWGELKSGINMFWSTPALYKKSAVFEYLASKNTRWDKRWIKKRLKEMIDANHLPTSLKQRKHDPIDIDNKNHWDDHTNELYQYGRALLGLAEHYEYATSDPTLKYQVKVKHNDIERFQSPVLFKIFNQSIYAIAQPVSEEMYNTPFEFEVQKKRNNQAEGNTIPINGTLSTPGNESFDLVEFLDRHFNTIGFTKVIKA